MGAPNDRTIEVSHCPPLPTPLPVPKATTILILPSLPDSMNLEKPCIHPTMIEARVEKTVVGSHPTRSPRTAVDFIVRHEANLMRKQLMLDQQALNIAKHFVSTSKFVSIKQLLGIHPIFEDSGKPD